MSITSNELGAAIKTLQAIAETIRELQTVPAGVLYANVAGVMSLPTFDKIIGTLERAELVERAGNVLKWIGPQVVAG